jgi:hypothetical protein
VRGHATVDRDRRGDRSSGLDDRDRRRPARQGAVQPYVLPQRRLARRSDAVPAVHPDLLDDVLDGTINPGLVLDFETDLDGTPEAYAAMDERRAIKSLIRLGSV